MGFDGDLEPCLSKKKSLNRDQSPTQKNKDFKALQNKLQLDIRVSISFIEKI